jgi:hypothetical protein
VTGDERSLVKTLRDLLSELTKCSKWKFTRLYDRRKAAQRRPFVL